MELTLEPPKSTFAEVYHASGFGYNDMHLVAGRARVSKSTIDALFFGRPVSRDENERANRTDWTLDTVAIRLEGGNA